MLESSVMTAVKFGSGIGLATGEQLVCVVALQVRVSRTTTSLGTSSDRC